MRIALGEWRIEMGELTIEMGNLLGWDIVSCGSHVNLLVDIEAWDYEEHLKIGRLHVCPMKNNFNDI